jgi:integrase
MAGAKKAKKKAKPARRMQGWRVVERGDSLQAWAWDPVARRYRFKTYAMGCANEARAWAQDTHAKFRLQIDSVGPRGLATTEVASTWLRHLTDRGRVEKHRHDCGVVLAHFAKAVPDLAAGGVEGHISDWWQGLAAPDKDGVPTRSAATRNRYLVVVRAAVGHAVEAGLLRRSPLAHLYPATPDQRLKPQFTVDELRLLLSKDSDPYHRRFALLIYAGLRSQEAVGLDWADVDWGGRVLAVRLDRGTKVKRRKERLVPLLDELADILRPVQQASGPIAGGGLANLGRGFDRFLERHGVPIAGRSPHSCRHSFAGMMTATGLPSLLLRAYLGHDSEATTSGYASMATRYVAAVEGWPRGQFKLRAVPG